ncbi:MAG: T9SS type A sorting domain-containing protein, partial [Bacteroidota bacterium]
VYFRAACDDKDVLLQWSTASEKDCKSFAIEKSLDGNDFETLNEITGSGSSTSSHYYSSEDRNPLSGISYYRLKQTDYNGTVAIISNVVAVKNCSEQNVFSAEVANNPSIPALLVNEPSAENLKITIFDTTGKLINSENVSVEKGENTIKLNTDHLCSSVYLIRIENKNQVLNKRILISR